MNDLRTIIKQAQEASDAYARRAHANGPGHEHNPYLYRQADRFHAVAANLEAAVLDAASRIAEDGEGYVRSN